MSAHEAAQKAEITALRQGDRSTWLTVADAVTALIDAGLLHKNDADTVAEVLHAAAPKEVPRAPAD